MKSLIKNTDEHLKKLKELYLSYGHLSAVQYNKIRPENSPTVHMLAKSLNITPPNEYRKLLAAAGVSDKDIRKLSQTCRKQTQKMKVTITSKYLQEYISKK